VEHTAAHETIAKKKSLIAAEQNRPDVAAARANFFAEQLKDVPLKNVVVLDESYATTQFTRLRGRCPREQRLVAAVPHGHWKTVTILAAITIQGVLAAASIDSTTDGEVFSLFIREVLAPALKPEMVVVMDNLPAHKVAAIARILEKAGCRLVYLPPYSPDYSPIENIWSKVKQVLRKREAREIPTLERIAHQCTQKSYDMMEAGGAAWKPTPWICVNGFCGPVTSWV
jgi:transposase